MHQRDPIFGPALGQSERARLIDALGISEAAPGSGPIDIVSTGHSKVMVPLRDRATLNALRPNFPALSSLSHDIGCNGFHTFVLNDPDPGILAQTDRTTLTRPVNHPVNVPISKLTVAEPGMAR